MCDIGERYPWRGEAVVQGARTYWTDLSYEVRSGQCLAVLYIKKEIVYVGDCRLITTFSRKDFIPGLPDNTQCPIEANRNNSSDEQNKTNSDP